VHELSVATELYAACRDEIALRGGGVLASVTVDVGELSAVEPDLLRFAWEAVVAETADGGAALEVCWCSARQTCPACGPVAERQPGTWLRLCPHCEAPLLVEGGRELDIVRLEFDSESVTEESLA
jgi:hydrogenase nickel incorporation protein HypA/HybF